MFLSVSLPAPRGFVVSALLNEATALTLFCFAPAQGSVPTARCHHTTTAVGQYLFVFGGRNAYTCFNDLYMFDTGTSLRSSLESSFLLVWSLMRTECLP